jgi:hypothetical protein
MQPASAEAKFGTLYLYDGDAFHATAFHNAPTAFVEHRNARRSVGRRWRDHRLSSET